MADGARTHDNRNHNPGLYQLSYNHRRDKDYRPDFVISASLDEKSAEPRKKPMGALLVLAVAAGLLRRWMRRRRPER